MAALRDPGRAGLYLLLRAAVQHVGWESLTTNVLKSQPRNAERLEKGTPAEQAQMLAVTKGFMEGFMVGSPAVVLIINALFALLLWGGFAFLLGGTTNYGEMFAVSIFASLPNALNSIIAIVTVFVSDPQTYNLNLPSPSALAYFLDPDSAGMAPVARQVARRLFAVVAGARRLRRRHRLPGQAGPRHPDGLCRLVRLRAHQDRHRRRYFS